MPEPAFSRAWVRRLLVTALTGAALASLHRSAAAECLETPTAEPGRWVYHLDRTTHQKCWHRAEAAAVVAPVQPQAAVPAAPAAAPAQDQSGSSLLSRVYNGISQSLTYESQSQQQQQYQQQYQQYQQQYQQYQQYQQQQQQLQLQQQYQYQAAAPAADQHRLRRRGVVRHDRPQLPAQAATTGAAPADQGQPAGARSAVMPVSPPADSVVQVQVPTNQVPTNQVPPNQVPPNQAPNQVPAAQVPKPAASAGGQGPVPAVPAADDRHDVPLNVADREALFQDFMKWQLERSMFGR